MSRTIDCYYHDPLTLIWTRCLKSLNIQLERSEQVFASWDGQGTMTLSTPEHFDPDDHLGQLILHELCHALTEGPKSWTLTDFGLENIDDRDLDRELVAHRLQATLSDFVHLRGFFAITTEWRPYYDALGPNPLIEGPDHLLIPAKMGLYRALSHPFRTHILQALEQTAALQRLLAPLSESHSLWQVDEPSLGLNQAQITWWDTYFVENHYPALIES